MLHRDKRKVNRRRDSYLVARASYYGQNLPPLEFPTLFKIVGGLRKSWHAAHKPELSGWPRPAAAAASCVVVVAAVAVSFATAAPVVGVDQTIASSFAQNKSCAHSLIALM